MNLFNLVTLAGVAAGFLRGRKRGLDKELYRLVLTLVIVVSGCGLYGLVAKALALVPGWQADKLGLPAFLATSGGAFLLMLRARKTLRSSLAARFGGGRYRLLAGLAGASRWTVALAGLLGALLLSGASKVTDSPAASSWLGTLLSWFGNR